MTREAPEAADLAPWVERVCSMARAHPLVDAFEVRADVRDSRRVVVQNGAIRNARINRVDGIGVRIFGGGGQSYAYANEITEHALRQMIERAANLASVNGSQRWIGIPPALAAPRKVVHRPQVKGAPDTAAPEDFLDLLRRTEVGAKEVAPDMSLQVMFGALTSDVILSNSAGAWVENRSVLSTLFAQGVVKAAGRIGDSNEWRGGERGVSDYEDRGGPEEIGREAARNAVEALDAVALPAGRHRTLTDSHMSGLLAHESFGHLTENDLVASGWSVLQGRLGETLASPLVTIRDEPFVEGDRKQGVSVPFDEEGTPGEPVTLLDRGVLRSFMHTRDSAAAADVPATGNGRALDARFPPIVRMRNTFFQPGESTLDEAMEALDDGVYLIGGRGGAPRSDGSFMFTSKRGYIVENGERKAPIRSVSIHGNVLDFLGNVELLTSDFDVHTNYFGGCGKWEQSFLHVGTGGPHVLVSEALVGGTAA